MKKHSTYMYSLMLMSSTLTASPANNPLITDCHPITLSVATPKQESTIVLWQGVRDNCSTIMTSHFDGTNWSEKKRLSKGSHNAENPQISANKNGSALAVWQQFNGDHRIIRSAHFNGDCWSAIYDISEKSQSASNPNIGIDATGCGIASWIRPDGKNDIVQAAHFDGTHWSQPEHLSSAGIDAKHLHLSVNKNGSAIAVWTRNNRSYDIAQARFFNGTDWSPTFDISSSQHHASSPQVVIKGSQALAVWRSSKGRHVAIKAARFDGTTWTEPTSLSNTNIFNVTFPTIAACDNGTAIALWQAHTDHTFEIQAAHFDGKGWGKPVTLATSVCDNLEKPNLVMDQNGNAFASWIYQASHQEDPQAQTAYFDNAKASWDAPETLPHQLSSHCPPSLSLSQEGHGIVIWQDELQLQSTLLTP